MAPGLDAFDVLLEVVLSLVRVMGGYLHANSEDIDQTDLSLRWAYSHFVGFVMRQLIYSLCRP